MSDDRSADRLAISEILSRYSWAICDRDWDAYLACFTDDGQVDYSTAGGPVGSAGDAAAWLGQIGAGFDVMISHGGNVVIDFDGPDAAQVRSIYRMTMRIPGETPTYLEACGYYRDTHARTAAGWRIANRYEAMLYLR